MESKIDKILFEMLILDGNETNFIENKETYSKFQELLIALSKVKYNVRFCGNDNCHCHPEHLIKNLLKDENLRYFLTCEDMIEPIEEILIDYPKTTIYDVMGI